MMWGFKRPVSQMKSLTYRPVKLSRLNLHDKLFDFVTAGKIKKNLER